PRRSAPSARAACARRPRAQGLAPRGSSPGGPFLRFVFCSPWLCPLPPYPLRPFSPLSLVSVADPDRKSVHGQQECQQNDNARCRQELEFVLGPRRPVEDLNRQGGE